MKSLVIVSFVLCSIMIPTAAFSQSIRFGIQTVTAISLEDGSGFPPSAAFDLNTVIPVADDGWGMFMGVGVNSSLNELNPNPQIAIGPTHPLGERGWCLGGTILYRFLMSRNGADANHLLGMAIVPARIFADGDMVLAFPTGPAYNVELDSWSLAFSAKISFSL